MIEAEIWHPFPREQHHTPGCPATGRSVYRKCVHIDVIGRPCIPTFKAFILPTVGPAVVTLGPFRAAVTPTISRWRRTQA